MRSINKDTINKIFMNFEDDKKNLSTEQVLKKYNISRTTYFRILKRFGLKLNC